jgi:hypothetical protein
VFRNSSTSLSRGQTNHTTNRGKPDATFGIPHRPILQDTASTAQALSSTGGPKIRVEKSSEDSKSP